MKFEEVLPALREGKKITSEHLKKCGYQYIYYRDKTMFENKGGYWHLTNCELVESDDWEIVKELKKVKIRDLTEEQYIKWRKIIVVWIYALIHVRSNILIAVLVGAIIKKCIVINF